MNLSVNFTDGIPKGIHGIEGFFWGAGITANMRHRAVVETKDRSYGEETWISANELVDVLDWNARGINYGLQLQCRPGCETTGGIAWHRATSSSFRQGLG